MTSQVLGKFETFLNQNYVQNHLWGVIRSWRNALITINQAPHSLTNVSLKTSITPSYTASLKFHKNSLVHCGSSSNGFLIIHRSSNSILLWIWRKLTCKKTSQTAAIEERVSEVEKSGATAPPGNDKHIKYENNYLLIFKIDSNIIQSLKLICQRYR